MYEDLVKRLRAKADYMDNNGITLYATTPFYRECADAIEELSLIAESNERSAARWAETAGKAVEQIPRWIPVTERLPEKDKWVLRYSAITEATLLAYLNSGGVWMDEQGEAHYVTHWMPLPEPPKEEA